MRPLRSFLFIPGDSEKKLGKADACGADAVILDLEDSVAPENKAAARRLVADFLAERPRGERRLQYWVRINPLDSGMSEEDVAATVAGEPDGIVHPKVEGPACVAELSRILGRAEPAGLATPILPIVTETPIAPFRLGEFAGAQLERLYGMTWGAEDLAAALGGSGNRDADGNWLPTFQMVRSLTLLAAHAAGVLAIDTLHADFRDEDGLRRSSRQARAEGFSGRLAIHPAQVPVINEAFTPGEDEIAFARRIVAAFDDNPGVGTVGIDGKMVDLPHLKAARRTLALADSLS